MPRELPTTRACAAPSALRAAAAADVSGHMQRTDKQAGCSGRWRTKASRMADLAAFFPKFSQVYWCTSPVTAVYSGPLKSP
eukprot:3534271-Prymnesium_polylepis.1